MKRYKKHHIHRHAWRPDAPDFRDHYVGREFTIAKPRVLPPSVDLRSMWPVVYDQGDLGSCTANGIAAILDFDRIKQKLIDWTPSRLFIYYNERLMEHTTRTDSGAAIRDGIKSISKQGAPPETLWPYDIAKFTRRPVKAAYQEALNHLGVQYARVPQTDKAIKNTLAAGFPIVLGITVYESFMSAEVAKTGIVPMPEPTEQVEGGHCVVLCGYDGKGEYLGRNSWGTDWGQGGYFTIPSAYIINSDLCSDLWVVKGTQ